MNEKTAPPLRRKYVRAVGPRLRLLLGAVLGWFALMSVNSLYLGSITLMEWWQPDSNYQNTFSLNMFLAHLVLGFLFIVPVLAFGIIHIRNAYARPNRRAVRAGLALFAVTILLIVTGVLLTRIEGVLEVRDPARGVLYWVHVACPVAAAWLFVLHRLAGKRIRWRVGATWSGVGVAFAVAMVLLHVQDPRTWNRAGPASGAEYFFPSLARTATGNFIPAEIMQNDRYCLDCHPDTHQQWAHSMHRFSSFNNPAYLFAVRETREVALKRDGDVQASRWCAGCHDPVPFFSGAFDDPDFDDVHDPTSQSGITCTVCHSITHVNSTRGNADYTIEEAQHYPFAFSDNPLLAWLNRQLIKSKPELHKRTFLKPLHKTPEFCSTCHKVHLPPELNHYRWLRGQNHYDNYHLSGVSGHGVQSFYYPPKAQHDCNGCHMPTMASDEFGARDFDGDGVRKLHDHQFPSANTGIPHLVGLPEWVNEAHTRFLQGSLRVDIFGLHRDGTIDGPLEAPLRPALPTLAPGESVLLDIVVRTMRLGHLFTQGTADSNEVWMDVTVESGGRVVGRSGGRGEGGSVDPWSHFVNAYVLDRHGNRIDRRNPQDIFVPLYNNQIPPGAADTVHYLLRVPEDAADTLTVTARLQYRKFDTIYMRHVYGPEYQNDLPIVTIAEDRVTLPVAGRGAATPEATAAGTAASPITPWERWNDYGIGLFRKGAKGSSKGELRQAEFAFQQVEALGRADGPINVARVYLKEGRLADAVAALERAARHAPPPDYPWLVDYLAGNVNQQNGNLVEALGNYMAVHDTRYEEARRRGFDFSQDYRLLNEIGQTLFELAKRERGRDPTARQTRLLEAAGWFEKTLLIDSEDVTAHYNLFLIYQQLGQAEPAERHRALHARYKIDDNAVEVAVAQHRARNPAADHASEAIVIYDLQRGGAFELPEAAQRAKESR